MFLNAEMQDILVKSSKTNSIDSILSG